jgi:hypothetical protein
MSDADCEVDHPKNRPGWTRQFPKATATNGVKHRSMYSNRSSSDGGEYAEYDPRLQRLCESVDARS